ncbi:integrase core domain-containing protein [Streptomyces phaeoluteigriseus]
MHLSVGRTGQCWDNALAESFFATIKRELLDATSRPSRAAARNAIFDFIEGWYNLVCTAASATAVPPNTRPHSQPDHHTDGVRQSGTSSVKPPGCGNCRPCCSWMHSTSAPPGSRSEG